MKKDTYSITVYKMSTYCQLTTYMDKLKLSTQDRELGPCDIFTDDKYDVMYFSYTNNHIEGSEIKWFLKWKRFFGIKESLRSMSVSGHGVIIVNVKEDQKSYALVFGHAFAKVSKDVDYEYGIDMVNRLLDGSEAGTVSTKYYSMVKDKSIFQYYEGSSLALSDGQALELISANILEDISRHDKPKFIDQLLAIVKKTVVIGYSYVKLTLSMEKIDLPAIIILCFLLSHIEEYTSRFPVPRMKPVRPSQESVLDQTFLNMIKNQATTQPINLTIPFYAKDTSSDLYVFLSGIEQYTLKYGKSTFSSSLLSNDEICEFIRSNNINDIRAVWLILDCVEGTKTVRLIEWIDVEIEITDETVANPTTTPYIMYQQHWCTFNDDFMDGINVKVNKYENEVVKEIRELSFSKEECGAYIGLYNRGFLEFYKPKYEDSNPYDELVYNYILSQRDGWVLFDRKTINSVEICDILVRNKAHIHVKIGAATNLVEALRQSLLGRRYYERNKQEVITKLTSHDGQTFSDAKYSVVIFMSDHSADGWRPSQTKSLKLKQMFIDWVEEIRVLHKVPLLIIARETTKNRLPSPLWERLTSIDLSLE
ncbi:MAG: DUF6119 family protein [Candidatus Izemoplasmatales bacterium]